MSMTLTETRDLLRDKQQAAVQFLEGRGFSREQIGHLLGYSGKSHVDNVMSSGTEIFGAVPTMMLFRFCSERGFDTPANAFSADGKANVEVHVTANGEITDDIQVLMEGAGIGSDLFRKNDPQAMHYFSRAVTGAIGLLGEGGVRFQPTNYDPCQPMIAGL